MTSWKIELKIERDMIPLAQEIMYGLDDENFPTLSDFEIEEGNDIRLLEAFFTQKPALALLQKRLTDILPSFDLTLSEMTLEEIGEKDWVSESQKLLQPVDAGLFFVYGSHDADKSRPIKSASWWKPDRLLAPANMKRPTAAYWPLVNYPPNSAAIKPLKPPLTWAVARVYSPWP